MGSLPSDRWFHQFVTVGFISRVGIGAMHNFIIILCVRVRVDVIAKAHLSVSFRGYIPR